MKTLCFTLYIHIITLSAAGCSGASDMPVPSGKWHSPDGHPDIETTDSMTVTVYHRTPGGICPVSYPIRQDKASGGYYISAAVRIMLSYDSGSGVLYLSPGGDYVPMK